MLKFCNCLVGMYILCIFVQTIEIMTDKLKVNDTLNCTGDGLIYIRKVTPKAIGVVFGMARKMWWIPKSVLHIRWEDENLTSEIGTVWNCDELPYFVTKNW